MNTRPPEDILLDFLQFAAEKLIGFAGKDEFISYERELMRIWLAIYDLKVKILTDLGR